MDPHFFKAAAAGNSELFKDMAREVIESLLTAKTKNTILHINIISQERENLSTKFVEEILEKCPSLLLQVNAKGDTPLHVAAKFGHSDIVRFLVERAKLPQHENEELESGVGAAKQMLRMTNNEKNTSLHEAACCENVDVVKILTKEDPDYPYSANNYGKTPLYMAAESSSSDMVLALLENSTPVSHEGPNGKTALHAAAMEFRFADAALRKLLEEKKNMIKETDQYGWTPIHYAAYYGNYEMVNFLLEIDQSASNIANKDRKMTALHLAVGQGHARTVETILSLSPDCYELVDNKGWNFLHYAMINFTDMNSVSIEIEEASLLDNNGETSQPQIDPNLFKVAAAGNLEPFKDMAREICPWLLLQVTAKGDTRSRHVAAKFDYCDIVSVLIERAKLVQHEDEELKSGVGASR
ncbi:hypothetical protein WN944_009983 [Citrus x changshan-huyou]|uniref:Uncharacterized protein n=1 Tax=Citrus x changshan-huyou TaxID=2935761 RepID=A0AAP0MT89_9ROSI